MFERVNNQELKFKNIKFTYLFIFYTLDQLQIKIKMYIILRIELIDILQ